MSETAAGGSAPPAIRARNLTKPYGKPAVLRGADLDVARGGSVALLGSHGAGKTAFRIFTDMTTGIFGRFRSMPIARSGVIRSHVPTSIVADVVSIAVVFGVAFAMGFRTGAGVGAWFAVAGILVVAVTGATGGYRRKIS
jgi:ABC-2 type transport system permease protein